jgi:hypothetical protein
MSRHNLHSLPQAQSLARVRWVVMKHYNGREPLSLTEWRRQWTDYEITSVTAIPETLGWNRICTVGDPGSVQASAQPLSVG